MGISEAEIKDCLLLSNDTETAFYVAMTLQQMTTFNMSNTPTKKKGDTHFSANFMLFVFAVDRPRPFYTTKNTETGDCPLHSKNLSKQGGCLSVSKDYKTRDEVPPFAQQWH